MKIFVRAVFIIAVPLLLVAGSISIAVNCGALYRYGFSSNNIASVTGISDAELARVADELIDYFNSSEDYVNITVVKDGESFTLFNEREVQHLLDVKKLFHLGYYVATGALVICLITATLLWWAYKDREALFRSMFYGGILTLLLMLALGAIFLIDFDAFFYRFHLLSFANDLWLLNPETDYLIKLFPQPFWFHAALFCAMGAAVGAIVIGLTGFLLGRHYREIS